MSSPRHARARLAATLKNHPDADVTHLRRDLAAANIDAFIRRVVAEAPPLTPEQIEHLRSLLPLGGAVA